MCQHQCQRIIISQRREAYRTGIHIYNIYWIRFNDLETQMFAEIGGIESVCEDMFGICELILGRIYYMHGVRFVLFFFYHTARFVACVNKKIKEYSTPTLLKWKKNFNMYMCICVVCVFMRGWLSELYVCLTWIIVCARMMKKYSEKHVRVCKGRQSNEMQSKINSISVVIFFCLNYL